MNYFISHTDPFLYTCHSMTRDVSVCYYYVEAFPADFENYGYGQ